MSKLIPSILTNPNYATNSLDTEKAGWYQIEPKSSNVALRVNYTNIGLSGEVRLNNTVSPPMYFKGIMVQRGLHLMPLKEFKDQQVKILLMLLILII